MCTYVDLSSTFPYSCRFSLVGSHCSHDDGVASSKEHSRRMGRGGDLREDGQGIGICQSGDLS